MKLLIFVLSTVFLFINPYISYSEKAKDLQAVVSENITNARSLKQEIESLNNSLNCQSLTKIKLAYKTLYSKFGLYDKELTDLLQVLINLQGIAQKVDGLSNGLLLLTVRNSIASDLDLLKNNIFSIELNTLFKKYLLLISSLLITLIIYLYFRKR
ncbi:MAG: hypothetical protein AB1755_00670 [Candidatus Omnitrophota bacterium]